MIRRNVRPLVGPPGSEGFVSPLLPCFWDVCCSWSEKSGDESFVSKLNTLPINALTSMRTSSHESRSRTHMCNIDTPHLHVRLWGMLTRTQWKLILFRRCRHNVRSRRAAQNPKCKHQPWKNSATPTNTSPNSIIIMPFPIARPTIHDSPIQIILPTVLSHFTII